MLEYSTNHEKLHPVFTLLLFSFTNVDPGCTTMPLHQKTNDWQLTKTKIQNFLPLIYCYIPQVTTRSCWQEKIIKKKKTATDDFKMWRVPELYEMSMLLPHFSCQVQPPFCSCTKTKLNAAKEIHLNQGQQVCQLNRQNWVDSKVVFEPGLRFWIHKSNGN